MGAEVAAQPDGSAFAGALEQDVDARSPGGGAASRAEASASATAVPEALSLAAGPGFADRQVDQERERDQQRRPPGRSGSRRSSCEETPPAIRSTEVPSSQTIAIAVQPSQPRVRPWRDCVSRAVPERKLGR